jgi:hypothetical protein
VKDDGDNEMPFTHESRIAVKSLISIHAEVAN